MSKQVGIEIEFRDPADMPSASYVHHPMEDIEPGESRLTDTGCMASALCDVLIYLAEGAHDLVNIGRRVAHVVCILAPGKLTFPLSFIAPPGLALDVEAIEALSKAMRRVWCWLGDARGKLSAYGMRGMALLYLVRHDLIDGMTLEEIGAMDNATRQNIDKPVGELRDILNGFQNHVMKSEETRSICQTSQKQK